MKKRKSYKSLHNAIFLDNKNGPWKKLNESNWYIKQYLGQTNFYIAFGGYFQAMPDKCFEITLANSKQMNKERVLQEVEQFKKELI